jgi:hypothetical protein
MPFSKPHAVILASLACTVAAAPPRPVPIGAGPRFHPPANDVRSAHGEPVGRLRCTTRDVSRFRVHVEVFGIGRVVIVPPGIGVAPPLVRSGAYVLRGRCYYPLRTIDPTGVIEIDARFRLTLGDLFAVWGQPLSRDQLTGFVGRVRVWVNGCRRHGDPRSVPLTRHVQIVLEVGAYVPPHPTYPFPRRH